MTELFKFKTSNFDIKSRNDHSFQDSSAIYYRIYIIFSDSKSFPQDLSKSVLYMQIKQTKLPIFPKVLPQFPHSLWGVSSCLFYRNVGNLQYNIISRLNFYVTIKIKKVAYPNLFYLKVPFLSPICRKTLLGNRFVRLS